MPPPENRANEALRRAIDHSLAVINFDPGGKILGANANFLKVMGYSENEVVGRHHSTFADEAYAQSEAYYAFWASMRAGHY